MKVLVYWHDMLLPHSAYLVKAFDDCPLIEEAVLLGPRSSTAEAIFNQQGPAEEITNLKKTKLLRVKTYRSRPLWCTFSEYANYIKKYRPDLILIVDEALSMNVFLAGLASKITSVSAKVIFYGFDNIYSGIPTNFFQVRPGIDRLLTLLKKTARFWLLDKALMPLRKRLIYGGLTSYPECTAFIHRYQWYPVIKEQWWPINIETFSNPPASSKTELIPEVKPNQHVVSFVGRFVKEKGVEDLINAIERLPESYQLLLIGAGEEQSTIENMIKEKKLADRISIIPPQNQSSLAAYFQYIDLLVLPSRTDYFWKEQYGRVLVEAMGAKTLVLGSDSGAIPYVINNQNLVFKEGNIQDLVRKIKQVFAKKLHQDEQLLLDNQRRALRADPQVFIKACCSLYDYFSDNRKANH